MSSELIAIIHMKLIKNNEQKTHANKWKSGNSDSESTT